MATSLLVAALEESNTSTFQKRTGIDDLDCDPTIEFWVSLGRRVYEWDELSAEAKDRFMNSLVVLAFDFRKRLVTNCAKTHEDAKFVFDEMDESVASDLAQVVSLELLAFFVLKAIGKTFFEVLLLEFRKRYVTNWETDECPVCYKQVGQFTNVRKTTLPCNHAMCENCRSDMIEHRNYKCPLCRQPFFTIDSEDDDLSSISDDETEQRYLDM